MSGNRSALTLWKPLDVVPVPKAVREPSALVAYAKQLTRREVSQIVKAFEEESYEIGANFVWQKTMSGLKKKLGALGMDFIGEMLDRRDIGSSSNPLQALTDHDALRLAEELGFFPSSQRIRLRQTMEIISHFTDPPEDVDVNGMSPPEAELALRTCIETVLGHADTDAAMEFAKFRKQLTERNFQSSDPQVDALAASPYFFQRTTVRVILATIKTEHGAQLEHALANLNIFLPRIWEGLLPPDRQSVGRCYAEVHAEGKQTAASGVRAALLKVKGFDYVPELLRSRTFWDAAQAVIDAHEGMNNFHNEPAPMAALASLGTSIPIPALPKCMTAILCVKIGNHYNISWKAASTATQILQNLSPDRWIYYLNECLQADDTILIKLTDRKIAERFVAMVKELDLKATIPIGSIPRVQKLFEHSIAGNVGGVVAAANSLWNQLRYRSDNP